MADFGIHAKKLNFYCKRYNTKRAVTATTNQFAAFFAKKTYKGIVGHQVFNAAKALQGKLVFGKYQGIVNGVLVPNSIKVNSCAE